MKSIHIALATVAVCLASCANLNFDPARDARPVSTIAAVAYVERQPNDLAKRKAVGQLREAAAKIQLAALAENPTAEAVAIALTEISPEPGWSAVAASLVRTYRPAFDSGVETRMTDTLNAIGLGLIDAAETYESWLPTK